jgi:hypothetical protein
MVKDIITHVFLTPSFELTTEHPGSSYGQPVLVRRNTGDVYGPLDVAQFYPSWGYMTACRAVERMLKNHNRFSEDQQAFIRQFTEFGQ